MVNTMYGDAEPEIEMEFMDPGCMLPTNGFTGPAKREFDFNSGTYCTPCHTHKRQRVETDTLGMDLLSIEPVENVCDGLASDLNFVTTDPEADLTAADFGDLLDPFESCGQEAGQAPALQNVDFATECHQQAPQVQAEAQAEMMSDDAKESPKTSTELTAAAKRKKFPGQNTQWSALEETFLVGAVMDWFFRHGSLTPARKGGGGKMSVWDFIKKTFDEWMYKYAVRSGKPKPQGRSAKALNRHYKSMKTHKNPGFYQLYKKFSAYESYLRRC